MQESERVFLDILEYLGEVAQLRKRVETKRAELRMLRQMAASTTGASDGVRVVSSGTGDKLADLCGGAVDLEKEIRQIMDQLITAIQDRSRFLGQLKPAEGDILHRRYIREQTLKEIAADTGKSYSSIAKAHSAALAAAQRLLDQRGSE